MNCEKCLKEIKEGKFVQVPCNQMTPRGLIPLVMHVVCCEACETSITHRMVGSAKIVEAEIVN